MTREELNRSLAIDAVHGTAAPNSGVLAVNPTAQRFPKCTHEEWACPPAVSIPFWQVVGTWKAVPRRPLATTLLLTAPSLASQHLMIERKRGKTWCRPAPRCREKPVSHRGIHQTFLDAVNCRSLRQRHRKSVRRLSGSLTQPAAYQRGLQVPCLPSRSAAGAQDFSARSFAFSAPEPSCNFFQTVQMTKSVFLEPPGPPWRYVTRAQELQHKQQDQPKEDQR